MTFGTAPRKHIRLTLSRSQYNPFILQHKGYDGTFAAYVAAVDAAIKREFPDYTVDITPWPDGSLDSFEVTGDMSGRVADRVGNIPGNLPEKR